MEDNNAPAVITIENPTRRLDNLPVTPPAKFLRLGAAFRVFHKHGNMPKDSLDQPARRLRIIECDVVGNGIEIVERGLRPDYFSHRAMRFFACA